MKIAIASGKGGTGKTTVATNLAWTIASVGDSVSYIDCDVEEPNGHIFLKPEIDNKHYATMDYPVINDDLCISCGKCAEICQYKAIIFLGEKSVVMPEMCHSCGGCLLVCPVGALTYEKREIGIIETGKSNGIDFVHGKLKIGQVMSPPLIKQTKTHIFENGTTIIDSPPGTSCPVIESVKSTDYVLLVTEPTPFGLSDFKLAVEVIRKLKIPFGTFINRSDIGSQDTVTFCKKNRISILSSLPDDRGIAETYSNGIIAAETFSDIRKIFLALYSDLRKKTEK
ncbi:ATP-binding protein [Candidatus Latescibacterota bacterium]